MPPSLCLTPTVSKQIHISGYKIRKQNQSKNKDWLFSVLSQVALGTQYSLNMMPQGSNSCQLQQQTQNHLPLKPRISPPLPFYCQTKWHLPPSDIDSSISDDSLHHCKILTEKFLLLFQGKCMKRFPEHPHGWVCRSVVSLIDGTLLEKQKVT